MKIAIVQFAPELFEYEKNFAKIVEYSENIESDIICFPELATTGYFFQNKEQSSKYAEPFKGKTYEEISRIAREKGKIIVYGYVEADGDDIYNSAACCFPDSKYDRSYRKSHLFYKEHYSFSPGNSGFFVIDYIPADIRIGLMICYDWRFPEAARSLGLQGADIIICPSNLVTNVWPMVMPARALENKVYLAIANRMGSEQYGEEKLVFNGKSAIYEYNGNTMAQAFESEEEVIYADIHPRNTRDKSFNEFNDIFKDRRPAIYIR